MSLDKKILVCTSATLPYNAGDGRHAFTFSKELIAQNQDASILTLNNNLKQKRCEIIDGVSIKRVPYLNRNLFQKLLSRIIIIPFYLKALLKSDIILIYGSMIGHELLILLGRLFHKRVIFRSTMIDRDDIQTLVTESRLFSHVKKNIYKRLSGYLSINPELTKSYNSIFNTPEKVLESCQGVDTTKFHSINSDEKKELKQRLGLSSDKLIITSIGWLIKRKGYSEIFETLSKLDIPFQYVVIGNYKPIAGYTIKKEEIEMNDLYKIGEEFLGDNVIFSGSKDNINEYLQASDIFLLNSNQEGTPNVLLEAMACGTAVVCREIKGLNNFITFPNKNSIIINSKEEIGNAINRYYDHPDVRHEFAKNGHDFIRKNCTVSNVAEKFIRKFC